MFYRLALTVGLGLVVPALAAAPTASEPKITTSTGWFSDKGCAAPKVARGQIGPNNPVCVKRCLDDGAEPVFVSEQAEALFDVKDYAAVKDVVGYRVEVTGIVDEEAKTITVKSVKRLEEVVTLCYRPKKKATP
jgi:hypothetical protein